MHAVLGGPAQRPVVERLVTAPGVPAPLRATAAHALAHIGGASTERYWTAALEAHLRWWERERRAEAANALQGLAYGLQLAGDADPEVSLMLPAIPARRVRRVGVTPVRRG